MESIIHKEGWWWWWWWWNEGSGSWGFPTLTLTTVVFAFWTDIW
jgi:hypothetical protein